MDDLLVCIIVKMQGKVESSTLLACQKCISPSKIVMIDDLYIKSYIIFCHKMYAIKYPS